MVCKKTSAWSGLRRIGQPCLSETYVTLGAGAHARGIAWLSSTEYAQLFLISLWISLLLSLLLCTLPAIFIRFKFTCPQEIGAGNTRLEFGVEAQGSDMIHTVFDAQAPRWVGARRFGLFPDGFLPSSGRVNKFYAYWCRLMVVRTATRQLKLRL
eukprot:IDg11621t1